MQKQCLNWEEVDLCWNEVNYDWDDVCLVQKIAGGGSSYISTYQKLEKEEKEKFITLICKVKGYEQTKERKKKIKAKLTAKDIEFTVNEVLKSINIKF